MSNSNNSTDNLIDSGAENVSVGEDRITNLCEQLSMEKQPQRDLYSGIEKALPLNIHSAAFAKKGNVKRTRRASNSIVYGLAASVCLVAVVAYFSYQSGVSNSGQHLVNLLSEQHQQQKDNLLASFAGTPEKTENWQAQSQDLDDAAIAIKKALENDPNNLALLKMLKKVHEQQISLIERVHAPAWQEI